MKISRILVPVDFSTSSQRALDYAIDFAKSMKAEIHLLHAFQIKPGSISPYGLVPEAELTRPFREAAERKLEEAARRVEAAGVRVISHLSSEFPSRAIELASEEVDADLIVMGTRGITGLAHVLLGSVAERTVRTSRCPVLTIGDESDRKT